MAAKKTQKFNVLIAGGDGGFGRELYNAFAGVAGVSLYSIQKGPPTFLSESAVDNWSQADFSFPDEVVRGIRPFIDNAVVFDAVFICVEQDRPVSFDLSDANDLDAAWSSNVSNPLMLCRYLFDFGAARDTSWFSWIVRDASGCGADAFPLRVARAAFPMAVKALFTLPEFAMVPYTFVQIKGGVSADHDVIISQLIRMLTEAGDRPNLIRE